MHYPIPTGRVARQVRHVGVFLCERFILDVDVESEVVNVEQYVTSLVTRDDS